MNDALALPPAGAPLRDDLRFVGRWLLLGGAAGGLAGFLVGGVGGRLAMFVLRFTSSESVAGVESDDGFTIGKISSESFFLLAITTFLGIVVGVVIMAVRSQLPGRRGGSLVVAAAGTFGAVAIISPDGVDFNLLSPLWVACLVFTLIPLLGAALMVWLIDRWQLWWWQDRRRTIVASLPWLLTVPAVIVFGPLMLVLMTVGTAALRIPFLRTAATGRVGRIAMTVVAIAAIAVSSAGLISDVVEIL
jgi:hypothetical protein